MCLFKKKKKKDEINFKTKFTKGEKVGFRYNGDLRIGYIYDIHLTAENIVVYDVQMGGECPVVINNVEESKIHSREGI